MKKLLEKDQPYSNVRNDNNETVLHVLVSEGRLDYVKWLFTIKAAKNWILMQKDNNDWSALHLACIERNLEMCEELLKQDDIDVMIPSRDKSIPLHYFVRHTFPQDTLSKHVKFYN